MPLDEKLVFKHTVVIQLLREGRCKVLLLGVSIDEELDDSLEKVLGSVLFVLARQVSKHLLKGVPRLHDIAVWAENCANAQVEFVLRSDVQLKLQLARLSHDLVADDGAFSFLLVHEGLQFFAGID